MPSMAYRVPVYRHDTGPDSRSGPIKSPPNSRRPSFSRRASSSSSIYQQKVIDMDIFQQILELDDDEEHEYSRELACAFFVQARTAFADMDKAYAKKDLKELASLGHFLKGSSAALGVTRVSSYCQKIEHYGHLRDPSPASSPPTSHAHSHSSSCSSLSSCSSTSSYTTGRSHHHRERDHAHHTLTQEDALAKIGALLRTVGKETTMAEEWLKRWYKDDAARWKDV